MTKSPNEQEPSLLEKAIAYKRGTGYGTPTDEQIDLALAWLKGDITYTQALAALGRASTMSAYVMFARALRQAYTEGKLTIK